MNIQIHALILFETKICRKVTAEQMFVYNIDPCMIRPCEHGAKCTPLANGNYTCDCPLGFVGQDCDEGIFFRLNDLFHI